METAVASRRHPQPQAPPYSSAPAFELGGKHDSTCRVGSLWSSLRARWAPSQPPVGPGESRTFWGLWVVVACLSIPTLIVVSGAYRTPLPFISGISLGESTSHWREQHQQRLVDGAPAAAPSAGNSSVSHLYNIVPPSPSPIPGGKSFSSAVLGNAIEAAARSPAPVSTSYSHDDELQSNASAAAGSSLSSQADAHDDELLGGLLAAGFDGGSCLSRYQSFAYRKASPHRPSRYLLQRLRKYEALHHRCGPLTRSYKRSLRLLKPGGAADVTNSPCKYVVWNPENGLGNRMLSMASAFLYALLSGRVLLVDRSTDLGGLFCEPFPHSTWLLPLDFPLRNLPFGQKYPQSYGNLVRANSTLSPTAFVYVHLSNDYDDQDKRFYCEADQLLLEKIPWMVLRSDQYFAPALFMNPAFEKELNRMFPEKEAVFHHLGRYLFHPSDEVWGLITSYYKDNLAAARERLGIQIRVFDMKNRPFDLILRQILNCTVSEKLLPEVDLLRGHVVAGDANIRAPSKAVLLTSLHSVFYERMREMYAGDVTIGVHQPSHEEEQRTGRAAHDRKALAEMYLLSLTDALVISARSTFGYVAQGLAGVTPRVLQGPVQAWVPEPACVRDLSPEPCFHFPPNYDCKAGGHADTVKLVPYTRRCRDFRRGVKLVDIKHGSTSVEH